MPHDVLVRTRALRRRIARLLPAAALVAGCAGGSGQTAGGAAAAPVDPTLADAAVSATALRAPVHVIFAWTLQESDAKFSGRGVTRYAPPLRARLDLFGPRDETYLSAALVDMELRLPAGAGDVPLPPPALLWSLLGTFRPPAGATLTAARRDGDTVTLAYALDGERWTFRLERDVLRSAQWEGPADGRRTIELDGDAGHGLPRQAVYRDWRAFRELRVTVQEAATVDGFPADTWTIGG